MSVHNYKIFLFDSARIYVIRLIWKQKYWIIITQCLTLGIYGKLIWVKLGVSEYLNYILTLLEVN